jgi:hypothetical protein
MHRVGLENSKPVVIWALLQGVLGSLDNTHRPDQGIANTRPLRPMPAPISHPVHSAGLDIRRHDRLGGIIHEYQHAA